MGEKPLRDLKREAAQAIERVRRNGRDLRKIEQTLQSNLKRLRELGKRSEKS
jgi:prefoldin subunit 5